MFLMGLCIEVTMNHLSVFHGDFDVTKANSALQLAYVSSVVANPWRDALFDPTIKAVLSDV